MSRAESSSRIARFVYSPKFNHLKLHNCLAPRKLVKKVRIQFEATRYSCQKFSFGNIKMFQLVQVEINEVKNINGKLTIIHQLTIWLEKDYFVHVKLLHNSLKEYRIFAYLNL